MIIISNESVPGRSDRVLSYDKYKEIAYSDEGFNEEGLLQINANEIEEEIYDALKGEEVRYFTLTGEAPSFVDKGLLDDWSNDEKNLIPSNDEEGEKEKEDPLGIYIPDEDSIQSITGLLDDADDSIENEQKDAKIYVFGSSKGGTGKTFTSIICTYRYAKTHPHQRIALIDFDIIDGQVGISIHKLKPTMRNFYTEYQKGYGDFQTMRNFSVKANSPYPQNVDFYLAPSNGQVINNDDFWLTILRNCQENYDVVVIDTGIDYLNINPISYAYKIADKILLITTTSIKSINSVTKQISKLKGESENPTYTEEDDIASHLNIVITQMVTSSNMNKTLYNQLSKKANVIATFGVLTDSITQAEFYGFWDIFDNKPEINEWFDKIMA